jgi:hypothetical protein
MPRFSNHINNVVYKDHNMVENSTHEMSQFDIESISKNFIAGLKSGDEKTLKRYQEFCDGLHHLCQKKEIYRYDDEQDGETYYSFKETNLEHLKIKSLREIVEKVLSTLANYEYDETLKKFSNLKISEEEIENEIIKAHNYPLYSNHSIPPYTRKKEKELFFKILEEDYKNYLKLLKENSILKFLKIFKIKVMYAFNNQEKISIRQWWSGVDIMRGLIFKSLGTYGLSLFAFLKPEKPFSAGHIIFLDEKSEGKNKKKRGRKSNDDTTTKIKKAGN